MPEETESRPVANEVSTGTGSPVLAVALTTAIVIQDAADMLRNISTVQVTAIGAATAAWITNRDPAYKDLIAASMTIMQDAADLYLKIGTNAFQVFDQFYQEKSE